MVLQKIYQQNQWYDSLSGHYVHPTKFLLFLTPQAVAFARDIYWVILFSGTPMFLYLMWGLWHCGAFRM
jgi:hypothetical protein